MGYKKSAVLDQYIVISQKRYKPDTQLAVWLGLAVWLSGNALASINVVALRQTRLVLGWVTVCGRANHLGM